MTRSGKTGGSTGGKSDFRSAVTIEDAAHAVNQINAREKREAAVKRKQRSPRFKPTLPKLPWDSSK